MIKKIIFSSLLSFTLLFGCSEDFTPSDINVLNTQVAATAQSINKGTAVGNISYHNLKTKFLRSGNRDVIVYLPPSYNSRTNQNYPVLYMHDGQNIFDKATGAFGKEWYIDEKVEYLIKKNVINEIIIVGIYNGLADRLDEYTWNPMQGEGGGKGKAYGEFLTKEVKPFIDKS